MKIYVRGMTGHIYEIELDANTPIEKLRQEVADRQGLPTDVFFLVFGGKPLKDGTLLSDYPNIIKGSRIQCVEKTIGGNI